jgi:transposase
MFFRRVSSKGNHYLQLVESFRNERGNPTHRVRANLGNISAMSNGEIDKLCQSFLRTLGSERLAFLEDLDPEQALDYGDVLPVLALWNKLHLNQIIRRALSPKVKIDVAKVALVLTANKVVDPQSKLGAYRWYDRSLFARLAQFAHFPKAGKERLHIFYRTLDYLALRKAAIERELYYQLKAYGVANELVLYDITSSYFEGSQAEMGRHGYSRDHRPDLRQIVIGLVVSGSGIPFAHHVFDGNTSDKTTVKKVIDDLERRFGIRYCIFVGDRGMFSRVSVKDIRGHEYDYIMGINKHHSKIVQALLPLIKAQPQAEAMEVRTSELVDKKLKSLYTENTRFIVGYNPLIAQAVGSHREQQLQEFEAFLKTLSLSGSAKEMAEFKTKIQNHLSQAALKRYFALELLSPTHEQEPYQLRVHKKTTVLEDEKFLDGRFFMQTEVKTEKLDAMQVVAFYKSLQKVERVFRVMKNSIDLRPIYVRKANRIRGHVFICFLAYLCECLLEKTLKEVLLIPQSETTAQMTTAEDNRVEAQQKWSLKKVKEQLHVIKLIPIKISNRITANLKHWYLVTSIDPDIQRLYSALEIHNARRPEQLHFGRKNNSSNNFSDQLALTALFDEA